jgi:hypothetical protein
VRHWGHAGAGVSVFGVSARNLFTRDFFHDASLYDTNPERKVGWLIGPYGFFGLNIPAHGAWSVQLKFVGFTYHRALNPFLRSVDGLVFDTGIGIQL